MSEKCFALYQGDKFLDLGTIDELVERLKIKKEFQREKMVGKILKF